MTSPLPGEPERLTDGVTWGQPDCEHSEWVDGLGPGGSVRQTCVDCGETYIGYTPAQLEDREALARELRGPSGAGAMPWAMVADVYLGSADRALVWMEREGFRRSVVSTPSDELREVVARAVADFLCPSGYEVTESDYLLTDRILSVVSAPPRVAPITDEAREGGNVPVDERRHALSLSMFVDSLSSTRGFAALGGEGKTP